MSLLSKDLLASSLVLRFSRLHLMPYLVIVGALRR